MVFRRLRFILCPVLAAVAVLTAAVGFPRSSTHRNRFRTLASRQLGESLQALAITLDSEGTLVSCCPEPWSSIRHNYHLCMARFFGFLADISGERPVDHVIVRTGEARFPDVLPSE
jgi:hypothetical protein